LACNGRGGTAPATLMRPGLPMVVALIVGALLPAPCLCEGPRFDQRSGRIRVLFIGDTYMRPGEAMPLMIQDPLVSVTPVLGESTLSVPEMLRRAIRLYLPRTDLRLWEGFDVVVITAVQADTLPANFLQWVVAGVENQGQGFLMADDPASFGGVEFGSYPNPSWGETQIGALLPVNCHTDRKDWGTSLLYTLRPIVGDHPLVRGIPWNEVRFFSHNRVDAKPGSTVVAVMDRHPEGSPCLVSWEYGKGRALAWIFDWGGNGAVEYYRWTYATNVMARMVYHPARVAIPDDLGIAEVLRKRLQTYGALRRFVISVMDFADRFGARLGKAETSLREADELKDGVLPLYASAEYDECMVRIDAALSELNEASSSAINEKDSALLWYYIVEWSIVSGTFSLASAILWALMVRRKLYAEVPTTRLPGPG